MSAAFPTSIKTFTARSAGQTIGSAHVNDLQDEVTAVETSLLQIVQGQVVFPAVQNPSANVNTLDDYEEGTWTPTLGGSATYTAQSGTYTKIGHRVWLEGHITVNAIGTGSTGTIAGVPYAAAQVSSGVIGFCTSAAGAFVFVTCSINTGTITLAGLAAAAASLTAPLVFFGNGTDVYFSVSYSV